MKGRLENRKFLVLLIKDIVDSLVFESNGKMRKKNNKSKHLAVVKQIS